MKNANKYKLGKNKHEANSFCEIQIYKFQFVEKK